METYSTNQVAEIAGVTLRQLQYWDESGYVFPAVSGKRRGWSLVDLLRVRLLKKLRACGMNTERAARFADQLTDLEHGDFVVVSGGHAAAYCDPLDALRAMLSGPQPVHVFRWFYGGIGRARRQSDHAMMGSDD